VTVKVASGVPVKFFEVGRVRIQALPFRTLRVAAGTEPVAFGASSMGENARGRERSPFRAVHLALVARLFLEIRQRGAGG
jgi:hypothetical protein